MRIKRVKLLCVGVFTHMDGNEYYESVSQKLGITNDHHVKSEKNWLVQNYKSLEEGCLLFETTKKSNF